MIYQSTGSKLKKFGCFSEVTKKFTCDSTHNWHLSSTCKKEEFHKIDCAERVVSNLVTGGGVATIVVSKKPFLSPRSSMRCKLGEINSRRFPNPMLQLFNKILADVCLGMKSYPPKRPSVNSRVYCEERQFHFCGLAKQIWMKKFNLSVLKAPNIFILDSIFSYFSY